MDGYDESDFAQTLFGVNELGDLNNLVFNAVLNDLVVTRYSRVQNAFGNIARYLLSPQQNSLNFRVIDAREVRPALNVNFPASHPHQP